VGGWLLSWLAGGSCEKRQASPSRHAPRAKKEHGARPGETGPPLTTTGGGGGAACEKRQFAFAHAPRAKKEHGGACLAGDGGAAAATSAACEKRHWSPFRQAPRAKKEQGGATVVPAMSAGDV
jgi:hypothetical protein